MNIIVSHPKFQRQQLSVQTASFLSSAAVVVDGKAIKRAKGKYNLIADDGTQVTAELKINPLDPIPQLKLQDEVLMLAPKLTWYEYLWTGLPLVLLFAGGSLGALIGASAAYANTRVFRSTRSVGSKYALTGLLSVGATVVFFVLATSFHVAINGLTQ